MHQFISLSILELIKIYHTQLPMQNKANTKIVCTIGPSCWSEEIIRKMVNNGMTAARINASFADHAEMDRVATLIRSISPEVTLILDLMGHKIRVTGFDEDKKLTESDQLVLASDIYQTDDKNIIKVTYPTLAKDITRGIDLLIDDGNIILEVKEIHGEEVHCIVKFGGILKRRKTVNIPGIHLTFPGLSDKDKTDIKSALELGYDYICGSFVRDTYDVELIRKEMGETDTKLIAKIEDYEGVQNFDKILAKVDAVMVARGDLGVELPIEQIPTYQREFVHKCRQAGKPAIVATQMLESMRENMRPTRAEVSDISSAVIQGTDAVMLSAETSSGKYPAEAVDMMHKTILETEKKLAPEKIVGRTSAKEETDYLGYHICDLVSELNLAGIITISNHGHTIGTLARHRLNKPIWCITTNPKLARQLSLSNGVHCIYVKDLPNDRDEIVTKCTNIVYDKGSLPLDSRVLLISGTSRKTNPLNNTIEIVQVQEVLKS